MTDKAPGDFLQTFRDATRLGRPLEAIAADVDGFADALSNAPDDLEAAMSAAADSAGGAAWVPAAAFASAACTREGRIVAADLTFGDWSIPSHALAKAVADAQSGAPRLSAIVDDHSGHPVALAVLPWAKAGGLPLDSLVRQTLEEGRAPFAVLAVRSAEGEMWTRLFQAWSLSRSEARLARALIRTGDLRQAASEVGVAYETARETVAAAMAKTGARRQPEFVRQLAFLAFGELPSHEATWQTFSDTFGLTARQGRLAQLFAFGATRQAAATALGVSDHSAKADLKVIYERCGISSGAALGRVVAEVDALARLASATDVEMLTGGATPEPLRFIRRRRDPGQIAVEDHGPHDAKPVIVFHTPTNGRHLPGVLVAALHARGLRPISVERPGYGLTTGHAGPVVAEANADLIDVLDALGIERARLLGRSCIMPLSFAAAHPERVDRGVLLSSAPPGVRPSSGFFSVFINMILDQPRLVEGFARMMMRLSSDSAIERLAEAAISGCPADIEAFAEPTNRRDYIRACRQSSTGDGFARELFLHADGGAFPPGARAVDWTVVVGLKDGLTGDGDDELSIWRETLPNGRYVVLPEGGRFLHLSHASSIADALA